jgi:hypothetical protein
MADDEKDDPDDEPENGDEDEPDDDEDEPDDDEEEDDDEEDDDDEEEDDERVQRLRARVAELESRLAAGGAGYSPAARWAGWVLGALVAATSLALIVVLLGGGLTGPCDCPEGGDEGGGGGATPEQQAQLEQLLRQHAQDFQACFDEWSEAHTSEIRPGWAVMVRLDVRAGEGGAVADAAASGDGLPEALGRCLETRVRRWSFPAPGPYTLEIPFSVEGGVPERDAGGAPADGGAGARASDARPAADAAPDR